jgi:hypothetical protein
MNPGIEQFLQAYAGMYQKDWVQWLPMAEFSYNNAVHSATGTHLPSDAYMGGTQ